MRLSKFLLAIMICALLLTLYGCSAKQSNVLRAEKGQLDLSGTNIEQRGKIRLDGEWEFYWKKLLNKGQLQDAKPDLYAKVPSDWENYMVNGKNLPGQGYATYRLHVKTDLPKGTVIGIKVKGFSSAYRMYVNDELIASSGLVGKNAAEEVGAYNTQISIVTVPDNEFDLIVQVSNFQYSIGGAWYGIDMGSAEGILRDQDFSTGREVFTAASFLMLAIFNLIIFSLRREYKYTLYFAFFCIFACFSRDMINELILPRLIPMKLELLLYLWHSAENWSVFFLILFLHELFRSKFSTVLVKIYFVFNIMMQILYTIMDQSLLAGIIRLAAVVGLIGILSTIIIVFIGIRNGQKDGWIHIASIGIVILTNVHDYLSWSDMTQNIYSELTFFGVFIFMILQLIIEARRIRQSSEDKNAAELIFLQAQIKPHFLYNALNTIVSVSRYDTDEARNLLLNLSNYLRRSFDFRDLSQTVPLKHEVELAEAYVNIEKSRFEERLDVNFEICDELEMGVPILVLQPIIENAVNHGVLPKAEGGKIDITIRKEGASICFSVKDDGVGIEKNAKVNENNGNKRKYGSGVGLSNVNKRLIKLYGKGLKIKSEPGLGTEITWSIPIDRKERKISNEKSNPNR